VVEVLEPAAAARGEGTAHLGPDLCRPDADLDDAVARMGRLLDPATDVATALLDQRVAAGIGNVYKCETLFACGVHPATPVVDVAPEERRRLLATAARQLRANLATHDRTTVAGGGVAVYGRGGRPCRRCGTPIASRMLGDPVRITYWCPRCQPAPAGGVHGGGAEVGAPTR
jgi:endonuclease-8